MYLDDLSDLNKTVYKCVADLATDAERKKGIHKYHYYDVYPSFPWKLNGVDHSNNDPKLFFWACENAGKIKRIRKEDENSTGLTMTYQQWLDKHKDEPGFVNHLESSGWR